MTHYIVELSCTIGVKTRVTVSGASSQAEAEAFAASAAADPAYKELWRRGKPDLADTPRQIRVELIGTLTNPPTKS